MTISEPGRRTRRSWRQRVFPPSALATEPRLFCGLTCAEAKAILEKEGVAVTGRGGDPDCVYFDDPDGRRLQLLAAA